jgi:hypothetical protein
MRTCLLLTLSCLVCGAMLMNQNHESAAADKPGKVLRHIVMYKFKDEATPQQIQQVIDTFAALPGKIDAIAGFEHGPNVSPEGKSEGFTHCFVVTFRDEKSRDTYLTHAAHQDYVKVVAPRREKVIVFDYWADR